MVASKLKKYSSLIQYNLKRKRALAYKQEALYSVMSNLNFGIYHVHFNTVFAEKTTLSFELTFLEMSKIREDRPHTKALHGNEVDITAIYSLGNPVPWRV